MSTFKPETMAALQARLQEMTAPQTLTFSSTITIQGGKKAITLIKSHGDDLSGPTMDLLAALCPDSSDDVLEVPVFVSEAMNKAGLDSKRSRVEDTVDHWAQIGTKVYNSLAWAIRRWPQAFYSSRRIIMMPYGSGLITLMVGTMLKGILGVDITVLNLISVDGQLVPNPKQPLVDLQSCYHAGRKLRVMRDEFLANPTPVDPEEVGRPKSQTAPTFTAGDAQAHVLEILAHAEQVGESPEARTHQPEPEELQAVQD